MNPCLRREKHREDDKDNEGDEENGDDEITGHVGDSLITINGNQKCIIFSRIKRCHSKPGTKKGRTKTEKNKEKD